MSKKTMNDRERERASELTDELKAIQKVIDEQGIEALEIDKHPDVQVRERIFRQKRLYAWCYWSVFQYFLEEYNLSQRRISEQLGKQPSTIAQMIHRNTFPSSTFETTIMTFLAGISSDSDYQKELTGLKRDNVISAFLVLDECAILDKEAILIQFDESERERGSDRLKDLSRAIKDLNEDELAKVSDYIEWLKSRR